MGNPDMARAAKHYKVDPGRVVHETVDGEVVLIQLQSGNYYSLRGSGADMWALLEHGATEEEIVLELESRYSPELGIAETVYSLLDELAAERLVEPGPAPDGDPHGHVPDRSRAGTEPFPAPILEKFTDMRDYLLVDPLHDVDERGWPHPSADSA
jgi:coenzyme PQQ synthesis protein D (PqqD)